LATALAGLIGGLCGPVVAMVLLFPAATVAAIVLFGRPASYPGSARVRRIERLPKWPVCKASVEPGWVFAEAEESHSVTEHLVDNGHKLRGEPAGRQIWHFDPTRTKQTKLPFHAGDNPNSADLLFRRERITHWKAKGGSVPKAQSKPSTDPREAARRGVEFYSMLQCEDGHWAGDYGGPMFLMPGMVITWYVTGRSEAMLSPAATRAMSVYIRNHQQVDGGWGTHIESPSTMFGSTLNYVALRLLGAPADDEACVRGRDFIREHGGALYTSSWAKLWL